MAAAAGNTGFAPNGFHPQHLIVASNATVIATASTDQRNHAAFAGPIISTQRQAVPTGYNGSTFLGAGGVT